MAFTEIIMENPNTGEIKTAPVGFSWTMLIFGAFVPLIRGNYKWFFIQLLVALFTFGLSWFVFIFIYNKIYIKELVSKGYKLKSVANGDVNSVNINVGVTLPELEATT